MKDNRFIELLNLYIDRQISVVETAELEAEIQQNPERQAVYRQYCQIHAATKLVYDSFRVNATEQPVLPSDRSGVVELFETKRRRSNLAYYAGGLVAAACLTLVFLHQSSAPKTGELTVAAKTENLPLAVRPAVVEVAAVVPAMTAEPVVGLVSLRNSAASTPDYAAMLAVLREQDEERAIANRHLQTNRVPSLFDDGLFNSSRGAPVQDPRLFRIQQTQAQQAETTVFQFQR
jgi:anti-sigma factor RsiW